ncbi:hypothetical protein [Paenibacillus sp. BJ-4]|uniref:hypothetical protein n=1 Tax=Paenibacillus sp. BJ-4 TaxID=2878097 RepID=UPI001CF0BF90|nr:hypothetical protein [Paenibacillus sp. BJ-4]
MKHQAKLQEKVKALFTAIEEAEQQENAAHKGADLPELDEASALPAERLEQAVQQLEEELQEKPRTRP